MSETPREEGSLERMTFYTSKECKQRLIELSVSYQMPMSRIIAYIIDISIDVNAPSMYDMSPPPESEEFAYADEGGKLINYMKKLNKGAGLDMLILSRYEIGIPDIEVLKTVFYDCLNNDIIEAFVPARMRGRAPFPEDYRYYRMKGAVRKVNKVKRQSNKYAKYLELKKEFEG